MTFEYFIFGRKLFEIGFTKEHRELSAFLKEVKVFISTHLNNQIHSIQEEIKLTGKTQNKSILAELITSG